MTNLKVSDTKDYLTLGGKNFFYLADTVWSSFTNASPEEWEEYLDYRKLQGFNALQINILPQWDRSGAKMPLKEAPFKVNEDGSYDFGSFNEAYFSKAQRMLEMAVTRGFVPALVLLWCNYVRDTWASDMLPEHIMPVNAVETYVRYVAEKFGRFDPIYLISGDTDFRSIDSAEYYKIALETIKKVCPDSLTTMHIAAKLTDLPEQFEKSPYLDFYMYQSGHYGQEQQLPYTMAEEFSKKAVRRPVINGEPCYEGHGYGNSYGRFNAFNVRKAAWQSLLSGASAGITYGAHGIWSWHSDGKDFGSIAFSGKPYSWRDALRFRGAWDVAHAKYIFEMYSLSGIKPQDIILNPTKEIRCAVTPDGDRLAIYAPYSDDIKVDMDLGKFDLTVIDMDKKLLAKPEVMLESGRSVIKMGIFNSDILIVGTRKGNDI